MDHKTYLEQITRDKGDEFAKAMQLASLGRSIMGMVMTCNMVDERQRDAIGHSLNDFFGFSMTMLAQANGWSHIELAACSAKYSELIKNRANSYANAGGNHEIVRH